jgi:hypothetical protein
MATTSALDANDALFVQSAERAALLPKGIAFTNLSEMRVVTGALVGVALQHSACMLSGSSVPVFAADDLIDIQRPFVRRDVTEFASERSPFQRLVSNTSRNLTETNRPMLPNGGPALRFAGGYRVVAQLDQVGPLGVGQGVQVWRVTVAVSRHQAMFPEHDARHPVGDCARNSPPAPRTFTQTQTISRSGSLK